LNKTAIDASPYIICLLFKIIGFFKKAFNNLTKRHLDFYYNEILQIEKNDAKADKVYVIFELAKKQFRKEFRKVHCWTEIKMRRKKTHLQNNNELIANQAKVVEIKSFLTMWKTRAENGSGSQFSRRTGRKITGRQQLLVAVWIQC
jgi:hypothetical protein